MDNLEILKNEIFTLPKSRRSEGYVPNYLKKMFADFLETISLFEGKEGALIKANYSKIENFCNKLISANIEYLKGYPVAAYNELHDGLESIYENLMIPKAGNSISNSLQSFYRMRVGDNQLFSRQDLFHIPFEIREIVKTQRFSIPGLPCIYLGNSIYSCWEELRRPDINTVQVSRIELDRNDWKFLDLTITVNHREMYKMMVEKPIESLKSEDWLLKFVFSWPLAAACSLGVNNDNAVFKAEYILPQLLLQWVGTRDGLDGISFLSSRSKNEPFKNGGYPINYVIPAKKINQVGYCSELSSKVKMTTPISWQLITLSNPSIANAEITKDDVGKWIGKARPGLMRLELVPGQQMNYIGTVFGRLEIETCKMIAEKII